MNATAPELSPEPSPQPPPTPEPEAVGQAWELAEEAEHADVIEVAEGSKEALAQQGEAIGTFVKVLDEFAITIGSVRISALM